MKDVAQLAAEFHDGDVVDVYFAWDDPPTSVQRVDFGGIETSDGTPAIVNYFVRADCTCDWIELDDEVVEIKLVKSWTERSPEDLATNTIGLGSRPASESAFALHGKRFRTTRTTNARVVSDPGRVVELPTGTCVTVAVANPDASAFVLVTDGDEFRLVLERSQTADLLEPI